LQQQEEVSRRERAADESCRNFAAARLESHAAIAALKLELDASNAKLQRAQGQLSTISGSQGSLQRLEEILDRFKRRGKIISRVVVVSADVALLCHDVDNLCFCLFCDVCTIVPHSGVTRFLQISCNCAIVAACFAAWAKCLHQRRFQSLASAAEAVQRQMHSVESMFNTKMSAITSDRDVMQEQLLVEREKVKCR
jgi:hypothetical protein